MSASKPTILIVDDDAALRAALSAILTNAGYETVTACSVPSASEILRQTHPDLVITDVRIDGYHGLQLAAMDARGLPVIVLTGFADAAIELEAERLGTTFLLKPVPSAVLLDAVAARLKAQN